MGGARMGGARINVIRKCTVKSVKIRRIGNQPGDFYFSWVAHIYRIEKSKKPIFTIDNADLIVNPNPDKEYETAISATQSGRQYMERVFKIGIIK